MDEMFTIDVLAARARMASRTIRQYQTAGLVNPPTRKGRIGLYAASPLERLEAIRRLQERGYSLAGMRDLFDAWERGRGLRHVIGADSANPGPAPDEAPVLVDEAQLMAAMPSLSNAKVRKAAITSGLIATSSESGTGWVVCSESALLLVADLVEHGVAATDAIALHQMLRSSLERLGQSIAATLGRIDPAQERVDFLRRNRAVLGRAAATLLSESVGRALPTGDVDQIRVGAVRDRRLKPERRSPVI